MLATCVIDRGANADAAATIAHRERAIHVEGNVFECVQRFGFEMGSSAYGSLHVALGIV
jgi:hypothetical protein